MKRFLLVALVLLSAFSIQAREYKDAASLQGAQINRIGNEDISIELPRFIFSYTNTKITIRFKNPNHDKLTANGRRLNFIVNGTDRMVEFDAEGAGMVSYTFKGDDKLNVLFEDASFNKEVSVISIWYVVLPFACLVLFIGYKLAFARKKLKVVAKNAAGDEEKRSVKPTMKVVKEEAELV